MSNNATSFTSPLATAKYAAVALPTQLEAIVGAVSQASAWTIVLTVLAILVAYDQCEAPSPCPQSAMSTHVLTDCLVSYIWQKGPIVGPAWKAPFIGPFLQSVNPKFEEYYAKWTSGPLSCVSVFHKCVVPAKIPRES